MLAQYSDWLFVAAVVVYVLAMVLHAYAQATLRTRSAVLVGAADAEPAEDTAPGRADRFAGMGGSLAALGALLHVASIAARGLATGRWPIGNMYEFISIVTMAAVVTWLVMLRRTPGARAAAPWVLLLVVVLMTIAGTAIYTPAGPVMPALASTACPFST